MRAAERAPHTLRDHITGSYFSARVGIAAIGIALPVLLWLGGLALEGEGLRDSMSAYYYSPTLRDVFVGALVAIGSFLYLYKGFSSKENVALNMAGLLAIAVAIVPTAPPGVTAGPVTLHGVLALLFFLCIAYVSVFRASDTLSLIRDTSRARRFQRLYRILGMGMIVSPVAAAVLTVLVEPGAFKFFLEAVAVWIFAAYWLVKSREMKLTHAERLALDGKLRAALKLPATTVPGRLVQVEPTTADLAGQDGHGRDFTSPSLRGRT